MINQKSKITIVLLLISILMLLTVLSYSTSLTARYYKSVYVNENGYLITEGKYHPILGRFLYENKMPNCYRVLFNKYELIVAFKNNERLFKVRHIEGGKVNQMNERINEQLVGYSHVFKYNSVQTIAYKEQFRTFRSEGVDNMEFINKINYKYNNSGKLIKQEYVDSKEKVTRNVELTLDNKGHVLKRKIYRNSKLIESQEYNYNKFGLPLSKKYYDKNSNLIKEYKYSYKKARELDNEKLITYKLQYLKYDKDSQIQLVGDDTKNGIVLSLFEYTNSDIIDKVSHTKPFFYGTVRYDYGVVKIDNEINISVKHKFISLEGEESPYTVRILYDRNGKKIKTEWLDENNKNLLKGLPKEIVGNLQLKNLIGAKYLIMVKLPKLGFGIREVICEIHNDDNYKNWADLYGDYFVFLGSTEDKYYETYKKMVILRKGYKDSVLKFSINRGPIINLGKIKLKKQEKY